MTLIKSNKRICFVENSGKTQTKSKFLGVYGVYDVGLLAISRTTQQISNLWRYTIDKILEYGEGGRWGYFHRQVQIHIRDNNSDILLEVTVTFNNGKKGRLDIYDPRSNTMYEVKPFYRANKGAEQIDKYTEGWVYNQIQQENVQPRKGALNYSDRFTSEDGLLDIVYATNTGTGVIGYIILPARSRLKSLLISSLATYNYSTATIDALMIIIDKWLERWTQQQMQGNPKAPIFKVTPPLTGDDGLPEKETTFIEDKINDVANSVSKILDKIGLGE